MERPVLSINTIHEARLKRASRRPAADFVLHLVSETRGISRAALLQPTRGDPGTVEARHLAMYLMNVVLQTSLTDIAVIFGRDRTTVGYACGRMEDKRDDKLFEANVAHLEAEVIDWQQSRTGTRKEKRRA